MKTIKLFLFLLVLAFVFGAFSSVLAADKVDNQVELQKIRAYIVQLDQKIEQARADKKVNKVAELKEEKNNAMAKADALQKEIAAAGAVSKAQVSNEGDKSGWQAFGGFGGGAALVKAGYVFPMRSNFSLIADVGFGLGNNFSLVAGDIQGVFPWGSNRLGLEITAANYSKSVTNVPGISGNIDQGTKFGAGVFVGIPFRGLLLQAGYNSALGLNAGAVYKF